MRKLSLILFIVFLFVSQLKAQNIFFENYTIKDGLPQNFITDMLEDEQGYIWFGTQLGISKFNGQNFRNFKTDDGLPDNYITVLEKDSHGNLWIGTKGGGIVKYDGEKFLTYDTSDGLVDNHVKIIEVDSENNIWIGTSKGLSLIKKDTVLSYTSSGNLPNNNILHIFLDSEERAWIATARGIALFSDDTIKTLNSDDGLGHDVIRDITEDRRGNIWIATQGGGLSKYRDGTISNFTTKDGLSGNVLLTLDIDHQDNLWIGTYQAGVTKYNGSEFISFVDTDISNRVIMDIEHDPYGNIWFRTSRSGVYKYNGDELRHFTVKNNLVEDFGASNSLMIDRQGSVWISSIAGVSKYSKAIFEHFTTEHGLIDNDILAISAGVENDVWISSYNGLMHYKSNGSIDQYTRFEDIYAITRGEDEVVFGSHRGLYVFDGKNFQKHQNESMFKVRDYINDVQVGPGGIYWCASDDGLVKFSDGSFKQIALPDISAKSLVLCGSDIWIATVDGLYKYNMEKDTAFHYTEKEGLPNNTCSDITKNSNCEIWVSTDNGLANVVQHPEDSVSFKTITTNNGLRSNSIYLTKFRKNNELWIGHEKGVEKINTDSIQIEYYGPQEGFIPMETNQGAVDIDAEGNMWFGTVDGLIKYVPENDINDHNPPETYITDIQLFEKDTNLIVFSDSLNPVTFLPVGMELPYNRNYLTFQFIGLHYKNPDKVRYKYKLEGFDKRWSDVTEEHSATYKKIPNGSYTFKVLARNNDGVWNEQPTEFSFVIKPPFWKTWWFYTLVGILAIFIVYLIIKARERKHIHDKRILEEKVAERTRKIENQKEAIQEANQELRQKQEEIEKQRDLAEEQRDKIAKQKEEITDSILYAQRIQTAVLPPDDYCKSILPNHFRLFKPRDIVSGDFYWMTKKGNKVVIVAADCTGHGVPGAFMSMLGVSFLNEIVNSMDDLKANLILNQMRYSVKKTLYQTRDDNQAKDGMDMALCIIDEDEKKLQFAGAYNSLYYIRNGELDQIKADRMPIGVHLREKDTFTNHEMDLQKGDVFYIFSDGYVDQFGGEKGGKFKSKPFKRLLTRIHEMPMEKQEIELDRTIEEWMGDYHQVDDIIVIGFTPDL